MQSHAPTVGICTLGCRVNQCESDVIAADFRSRGCIIADFNLPCDIYIVNTCTVTAESDRKSRQMIRRALHKNPSAFVAVCGCFSQVSPRSAAIDGVALVTGNVGKTSLARRVLSLYGREQPSPVIEEGDIGGADFESCTLPYASKTRAFVKIEDGCDCRCAYCIIPSARGHIRSKPKEDVIAEIRHIADCGCREVVLTGIETASYGLEFADKYRLSDLLADVGTVDGIERIRMGSLTPAVMTREFADTAASLPRVMPNFHLSMQSGSDRILHAMRRRYNTEMALENIAYLRKIIPDVTFGTDIMTGFPGETDADFAETVDFCRRVRFANIHIFAYSRRAGTEAAFMPDQVDEHLKNLRSAELQNVADLLRCELAEEFSASRKSTPVLFETFENGVARGHNPEFFEVEAASDKPLEGLILDVEINGANGGVIKGTIA